MAFDILKFSRMNAGVAGDSSIQSYSYLDTATDTLATIKASDFFSTAPELKVNDILFIVGTDGSDLLKVSSLSPTVLAEYIATDGTNIADGSISTAKLADQAVTMAKAAFPIVTYNSTYTTTGGGVTETISGSFLDTEKVQVTTAQVGATPVTLVSAICNSGNITLTFSADPSTDHKFNVTVFRG